MFIGIYSIANFITLMGLTSSVVACFLAGIGSFKFALFMLFLAHHYLIALIIIGLLLLVGYNFYCD